MQSDRHRPKTDTFNEPTAYEPNVWTISELRITFARHEYGRVGDFKIKMKLLV